MSPALFFVLLAWPLLGGIAQEDAVQVEWVVRRQALEQVDEFNLEAVSSRDWRARHALFDALARSPELSLTPQLRAALVAGLEDAHPNVRLQALRAGRRVGLELPESLWERLAKDELALVRSECARALSESRAAAAPRLLQRLTHDEDGRVYRAALLGLYSHGAGAEHDLLPWISRVELAAFLDALEFLSRSAQSPQLLVLLDEKLGESEEDEERLRSALWQAWRLGEGLGGELERLNAGWAIALPDAHLELRKNRRLSLGLAACVTSDPPAWVTPLLADAEPQMSEAARFECIQALCALLCQRPEALVDLCDLLPAEHRMALWEQLPTHADRWPPEPLRRVYDAEQDAGVRLALCSACAEIFLRTGDVACGDLLAHALEAGTSEERKLALSALVGGDDPSPWQDQILHSWRQLRPEAKKRLLRRISREVPLPAFRDELLAAWEDSALRSVSVLELLARLDADPQVAERIAGWLEQGLRRLESQPVPAQGEAEPGWIASEAQCRELLRAYARMEHPDEPLRIEDWLRRSEAMSEEVSKACAAALGKSARGRELLRPYLAEGIRLRVRIEAALQLAMAGDPAGLDICLRSFPTSDDELRVRFIRAWGRLGGERCGQQLARVVRQSPARLAEAQLAIEAISELEDAALRAKTLAELLEEVHGVEVLRAIIEAVGWSGLEALKPRLLELQCGDEAGELVDEILLALARIEAREPSTELLELWLARPLAAARSELGARFRGERLAACEFAYRAEIAVTGLLAEAGSLERSLAAAGAWWRMDGRLLLRMGEAAFPSRARSGDATRRLYTAALAAFEGEAPRDDLQALRCHARAQLLRLALDEEDWVAAGRWGRRLLSDWRADRTRPRAWAQALGEEDHAAGSDPGARLAAGVFQCEALAALEAGRLAEASAALDRARELLGFSAAARRAQSALRVRLEEAENAREEGPERPPPTSPEGASGGD